MRPPQKIEPEIIDLLHRCTKINNTVSTFSIEMDRDTYQKVNKVLEALGGKWNRKLKAHIFDDDIESAELLGDVCSSGEYINYKQAFQQFFTPPSFAAELVERAGVEPEMTCLEPSAGGGAIANAMVDAGGVVDVVEIDPKLVPALRDSDRFRMVREEDFLKFAADSRPCDRYDRIIMNPPFTRSQDIKHVRAAYELLEPGGDLVAVMSPSFTFRSDYMASEFLGWANSLGATWQNNPKGTFKESGTSCDGLTFVVRKPE